MAVISKIETQRNKSRVNIFVDDSFFCGLNKETAIIFGLKVNQEIDEDKLKEAIFESEVKSAFEKSLDIVGRRMNSKKELRQKLLTKGYALEVIERVVEKLEEYRYVDDALFARQFASSYQNVSKKNLKEKLQLKGISPDIVLEIISDRCDEDEFELCLMHANKYLKSKPIKSYQDLSKMQASLARKGFDFDVIKKVCREIDITFSEERWFIKFRKIIVGMCDEKLFFHHIFY